ncbi:probable ATP-dependent RNA helicase [Lentisphaera araneosa HTCC2155]|uniref:Probable ATP-dependent RNA helicase n=1 Tax=Lentisphaera araneosa HTCC2155 TaxID=313628 RepID=A6DL95_9BACT|nr:DEAD/DEAH box helicase [Lentisphaera araneosa]EDM27697.1 probable ATP-dependent RNA helicase [Lentisphaera araneosa HTCC2155]
MNKNVQFQDLGLKKTILSAIYTAGYKKPTPIQNKSLKIILQGQDALVRAKTGTGKTAAFAIPALQHLRAEVQHPQVLILTPGRELCKQISQEFIKLGKGLENFRVAEVTGGGKLSGVKKSLHGAQVISATPGRLIDIKEQGLLNSNCINMLVIDEADRLFDMGFREAVTSILKDLPKSVQTVLCSATFTDDIKNFSKTLLKKPVIIEDRSNIGSEENLEEWAVSVYPENHLKLTEKLLKKHKNDQVIVFCNHKERVDEVAEKLDDMGFDVHPLHSGMEKNVRNQALKLFRDKQVRILVATDVASRGIDIPGLPLVVNYDLPYDFPDYVHRAGRTARAGKSGLVISFYNGRKEKTIKSFEERTGRQMLRVSFNQIMDEKQVSQKPLAKKKQDSVRKKANIRDCSRIIVYGGKKQGLNNGLLKKILAKNCGLDDSDIGYIEVNEKHTLLGVLREKSSRVLTTLQKTKISGHILKLELRRTQKRR